MYSIVVYCNHNPLTICVYFFYLLCDCKKCNNFESMFSHWLILYLGHWEILKQPFSVREVNSGISALKAQLVYMILLMLSVDVFLDVVSH